VIKQTFKYMIFLKKMNKTNSETQLKKSIETTI
jgi:hypothetical protein